MGQPRVSVAVVLDHFVLCYSFSLYPACVTMLIARVDNIYQRVWYVAVAVIASGCQLRSFGSTFSRCDYKHHQMLREQKY